MQKNVHGKTKTVIKPVENSHVKTQCCSKIRKNPAVTKIFFSEFSDESYLLEPLFNVDYENRIEKIARLMVLEIWSAENYEKFEKSSFLHVTYMSGPHFHVDYENRIRKN